MIPQPLSKNFEIVGTKNVCVKNLDPHAIIFEEANGIFCDTLLTIWAPFNLKHGLKTTLTVKFPQIHSILTPWKKYQTCSFAFNQFLAETAHFFVIPLTFSEPEVWLR